MGQFGKQRDGYLYGVEILDNNVDLWGIEFPPVADSNEAVARMLLECCYCHNREVIYLNGLELRAFETNRGVAHHCRSCARPEHWTQTLQRGWEKARGPRKPRKRSSAEVLQPKQLRKRTTDATADAAEDAAYGVHPAAGNGRRTSRMRRHFANWHVFSQ